MKHVFAWELKQRKHAILWWIVGSIVMTGVILALYPSIRDQANELNSVINELPQELRGLKTGGEAAVNVADPVEFLNSQLFYATLPILWIILAVTRGPGLLAKDEESHTLELLLAKPISRTSLLTAKILSFWAEALIIAVATLLATVLIAPLVDINIGMSALAWTTLYTMLFSVSFGYIAFALHASGLLQRKAATAIAVVLGFGGYILASLEGLTDWLEWPAKFVPYHYFQPAELLSGDIPAASMAYIVLVIVVGTALAVVGFKKRDIS